MPVFAQTVGFSHGNSIQLSTYGGYAYVQCAGNIPRTIPCYASDAEPGFTDVLTTSAPIDADSVTLVATHEGGKQATKNNVTFKNGASDKINLLITSLFQRPLLDIGQNKVDYTFKKGATTVLTGSIQVEVGLKALHCPSLTLFEAGPACLNENDILLCNDYFNRVNGCQ